MLVYHILIFRNFRKITMKIFHVLLNVPYFQLQNRSSISKVFMYICKNLVLQSIDVDIWFLTSYKLGNSDKFFRNLFKHRETSESFKVPERLAGSLKPEWVREVLTHITPMSSCVKSEEFDKLNHRYFIFDIWKEKLLNIFYQRHLLKNVFK